MSGATLIVLALVIPAAGAVLIGLLGRHPNLRETVTLASGGALLAVVVALLPQVLAGERPATATYELFPGVAFGFEVEPLGMLFALVTSSLWIVTSVYSIGYMRGNAEPRQTPFYVFFAVAIASAIGVAFAANLVTLFLFYEILTISTYPLVTHKGDADAMAKGRVYLLLLLGTSMILLLPAVIWTGIVAGTLDFEPGGILAGRLGPAALAVLLALFIFGIGKAAVMPVHAWLPAAMVAPTPVSALLHAVAVVKAGVFAVVKVIVYTFGVDTLREAGTAGWLVWVAGFTIIMASIVALGQDNLKRRLAYSTVSQLSYVILGAAMLTPLSVMGAAVHIAGHAAAKITLFFAAGSIYTAAHKTEISELDGIGRRMPWTMTAFAVGAVAMIGLPPTSGFLGKWFMLSGAMATEQWLPVAVIVASTILNALYFLPIVHRAFFRPAGGAPEGATAPLAAAGVGAAAVNDRLSTRSNDSHEGDHGEAPLPIVIALVATAILTVVLFVFPDTLLALAHAILEPVTP